MRGVTGYPRLLSVFPPPISRLYELLKFGGDFMAPSGVERASVAYYLVLEYMDVVGQLDEHCQSGLRTVLKRMCLRDTMVAAGGNFTGITLEEQPQLG